MTALVPGKNRSAQMGFGRRLKVQVSMAAYPRGSGPGRSSFSYNAAIKFQMAGLPRMTTRAIKNTGCPLRSGQVPPSCRIHDYRHGNKPPLSAYCHTHAVEIADSSGLRSSAWERERDSETRCWVWPSIGRSSARQAARFTRPPSLPRMGNPALATGVGGTSRGMGPGCAAHRRSMPEIRNIQITSHIAIIATIMWRIHWPRVLGSVRFGIIRG